MTTNDEQYVPSDEDMRSVWVVHERDCGWEPHPGDPSAEFDRFLARVRRDAAREALDGLVGALNTSVHEIQNGPTPNPVAWQTGALWTRDLAKIHRDAHYPEETP